MTSRGYTTFRDGTVDELNADSIPAGAAERSLNFLTRGDHIEQRRGYVRLGVDRGDGQVTGLHVMERAGGAQVLISSYGKKVEYWNTATEAWVEVTTAGGGIDILGAAADGEEISFKNYETSHGAQCWFSSPNSGLFKIMVANPGVAKDNYVDGTNYKGRINIADNRMFLWYRNEDKTSLYLSWIDSLAETTVSAEVIGTGNGVNVTFSNTLSAITGRRTAFGIVVTDGVETFRDDYQGNLIGSLGGTGTINYSTGAISVTFNSPVTNLTNVVADYQWEESTTDGIADFTFSATRLAGEGDIQPQSSGGAFQSLLTYRTTHYCLHENATWAFESTADDRNATNVIFRSNVGIPNHRAAVATGDGIYYMDDVTENTPRIRLLTFDTGSSEVVPVAKSMNLNLRNYLFDKAAAVEWGDEIFFACRTKNSPYNNRVVIYNKLWNSLDVVDYWVSCFAVYEGSLLAGDPVSNNVYVLFSGFDDDGSSIPGDWVGWMEDLNLKRRLKKVKDLVIQGLIGPDQVYKVYGIRDRGPREEIGEIRGDGDYVDSSQSISVGAPTVGRLVVGGGSGAVTAHNYVREFDWKSAKFEYVQIEFESADFDEDAQGVGFFSVSGIEFRDIRDKGAKVPRRFRAQQIR